MPGTGYTVTVNVFSDSPAGHVNLTLSGPGGWSATFGNNVNGGTWGVRMESLTGRNPYQTTFDISYDQFMAMYNWASDLIANPQNSYGLHGGAARLGRPFPVPLSSSRMGGQVFEWCGGACGPSPPVLKRSCQAGQDWAAALAGMMGRGRDQAADTLRAWRTPATAPEMSAADAPW